MIKRVMQRILPDRILMHMQAADHYFYGERELRLVPHLCNKIRVSLDIGANIGTYTYFIRKHSRQVHAFEPNPDLAAKLAALFPDVTVHQAAVSDHPGQLRLRIPIMNGRPQHELASVADEFPDTAIIEHVVPAIRIDDMRLTNVGFIKVDAEQHELPALRGALETIRGSRPKVMTEVTPLLYPKPLPEMFGFLTDLGYEGWFGFEGSHYRFSQFDASLHANRAQWGTRFMENNVIFLPREEDASFLQG